MRRSASPAWTAVATLRMVSSFVFWSAVRIPATPARKASSIGANCLRSASTFSSAAPTVAGIGRGGLQGLAEGLLGVGDLLLERLGRRPARLGELLELRELRVGEAENVDENRRRRRATLRTARRGRTWGTLRGRALGGERPGDGGGEASIRSVFFTVFLLWGAGPGTAAGGLRAVAAAGDPRAHGSSPASGRARSSGRRP